MLMSIIKLAAVFSFLTSRKYWNSKVFYYRTCQPVPNRKITHFPDIHTSKPAHDGLRNQSTQRYVFSPRPKF